MIPYLLHDLLDRPAAADDDRVALECKRRPASYGQLRQRSLEVAGGLRELNLERGERIAVLLPKSIDFVIAVLAASRLGLVFVPINPALKPDQIAHILRDCDAAALVTTPDRVRRMRAELSGCRSLRLLLTTGALDQNPVPGRAIAALSAMTVPAALPRPCSDDDLAALFYTSGSTGRPKGVMLSHRNLVTGATSVADYLGNHSGDRILGALSLGFDAGFSQITTSLCAGATLVLKDYLFAADIVRALIDSRITGITAVPPMYAQLAEALAEREPIPQLRYFASTGARMPGALLTRLRRAFPEARPYLMYGLTEAFRSTYLDPAEVDRRPASIGKAIPNQEVLVVDRDGRPCAPFEVGEIVHRGSTVGLGYWNRPDQTANVFRPYSVPGPGGASVARVQVHSGDYGYRDEDGFLFFSERRDAMIKSRGYRISPTEIEDEVYREPGVSEAVALGVPDEALGAAVILIVHAEPGVTADAIRARLEENLPSYMLPARIVTRTRPLERTASGKLDRQGVRNQLLQEMEAEANV